MSALINAKEFEWTRTETRLSYETNLKTSSIQYELKFQKLNALSAYELKIEKGYTQCIDLPKGNKRNVSDESRV